MKRTRYVSLVAAVFLAAGIFAAPEAAAQRGPQDDQDQRGPEQRIERHINMLDDRLELSDEQETQVRELLTAHAADARAWIEDNESATREERRTQMRASWTDLQESLTAVLTPEQAYQLAELRERMQNRRERGERANRDERAGRSERGPRGGEQMRGRHMDGSRVQGRHMDRNLFGKLELSDEQKEQMKSLHEERRAQMQEWRAQNDELSREERRAQMRAHAEEHRAALLEILTDDQERQLGELRSEWREQMKEHRESRGEHGRHRRGQRDKYPDRQHDKQSDARGESDNN